MSIAATLHRELDYRAYMTCLAQDGWLPVVERELAGWMRRKYRLWDLDLGSDGQHMLSEDGLKGTKKSRVVFDIRRHEGAGGLSLRARLTEIDDAGARWRTELVAHDHRGDGDWIWLTVTNDRGQFVSVPRLAKDLMSALPLTDSTMQYVPEPQVHRHQDVDDVLEVLTDERRHGLVFVAGTDNTGRSVDDFTKLVSGWTREAYGLAQVIVLDPLATAEFNRRVGPDHAAKAWSIRTYHPGVVLDDPSDARRHRYLTRATQSRDVQQLLGTITRSHAANRSLPSMVERVRRSFERLENKQILDAISAPARTISPRPTLPGLERPQKELPFDIEPSQRKTDESSLPVAPPSTNRPVESSPAQPVLPIPSTVADEAEKYLKQVELVKSILGLTTIDETALAAIAEEATRPAASPAALTELQQKLDSQQSLIDSLRDERALLEEALRDAQASQIDAEEALDKARGTERWLRNQLDDVKAHDVARAEVPDELIERPPGSFSELVEALESDMDGPVVFTGDADLTLALEVNDLGTACRAAWDAILALRDYVRARNDGCFEGSVDHYLKHTPSGYRNCPSRKHAQGETAITMQQWGRERVFSVPPDVDPSGEVTMAAHFKLAQIARVSPRLHYYDDWTNTGRIYIGYIGPHLTNTQTD